ncbi:MAG: hypothetical protein ACKO37_04975 [Vampirovibrionales bacterium]
MNKRLHQQARMFNESLGVKLEDRHRSNFFVQPDPATGRLQRDKYHQTYLTHIDYGQVSWLD